MSFLFLGFFTGLSLIFAIGAQNIFVIEQGLKKQFVFIVCLICVISDFLLIFLGIFLFHYFDAQFPNKRVVFVGSSDLAHTHLKSGPYGFSKYAEPFDLDVGKWAKDPEKEEDALLKDAANIEQYALSCGFPSLVMLHGFLRQDFSRFHPVLLANEHPTYYGMMVSTY